MVKLGQIVTNNCGEAAIAQDDELGDKVLVRIAGLGFNEYWNIQDIVEVEDRDIIKALKASC